MKIIAVKYLFITFTFFISFSAIAGNTTIESFSKAKKLLQNQVYSQLPHLTIYCTAEFDEKKRIVNANGFYSEKYKKRAKKAEWEHIVPAENFGKTFREWREGHPSCISKKGKPFKGRNCASKLNKEYRYMQSDMYNLYPAIGAVNALRSNYRHAMISGNPLGNCKMIIDSADRKAMPPDWAKGIVARVSLYFDQAYLRYKLSDSQRKLFESWDREFPVTGTECKRNDIIEKVQGNVNEILKSRCIGM